MEEATALKNKGNDAFKNKEWPSAIDFYSRAIAKYDKEPSFYTNRAQVCRISSNRVYSIYSLTRSSRPISDSKHTDMLSQMLPKPLN